MNSILYRHIKEKCIVYEPLAQHARLGSWHTRLLLSAASALQAIVQKFDPRVGHLQAFRGIVDQSFLDAITLQFQQTLLLDVVAQHPTAKSAPRPLAISVKRYKHE